MPRKVRKGKIRRGFLTDGQLRHLAIGCDFFGDGFGREDTDEQVMREAWAKNRSLVADYTREHWPGAIVYARLRFDRGLSRDAALAACDLSWRNAADPRREEV